MDESFKFTSKWIAIDDEPEETKGVITTQNWFESFFNHSYIQRFTVNLLILAFIKRKKTNHKKKLSIHRALIGKEYALSFESVVQFEDVMTSSVFTIPKKFRLCDSFKDTQECIEAINE